MFCHLAQLRKRINILTETFVLNSCSSRKVTWGIYVSALEKFVSVHFCLLFLRDFISCERSSLSLSKEFQRCLRQTKANAK